MVKTIRLTDKTHKRLSEAGTKNLTYDEVIIMLLDGRDILNKNNIAV